MNPFLSVYFTLHTKYIEVLVLLIFFLKKIRWVQNVLKSFSEFLGRFKHCIAHSLARFWSKGLHGFSCEIFTQYVVHQRQESYCFCQSNNRERGREPPNTFMKKLNCVRNVQNGSSFHRCCQGYEDLSNIYLLSSVGTDFFFAIFF